MEILRKDENGFVLVYIDPLSNGKVWRHELVLKTVDDYYEVFEVATDHAKLGSMVKILPVLHYKDPLRKIIFKNAKENKCPDLQIDDIYADVKTPLGGLSNACIDRNIQKGHKQANCVIVRIVGDMTFTRLKYLAKNRLDRHDDLVEVKFKVKGVYYSFTKTNTK